MINKDMSLADVVKMFPKSVEIFNDFQIDFCCGGKDTLKNALEAKGINSDSFVMLLNKKMKESESAQQDKTIEQIEHLSVNELIEHIYTAHHVKEKELLGELDKLINKILIAHYENHKTELLELHGLYANLKKELEEHFVKEEGLVFPYMNSSQSQDKKNIAYLKELEDEHYAAGDIIKKIDRNTNSFTPPEDACPTYILTFRKLKELVEDIFIHIFKENSILFPMYEKEAL